MQNFQDEEDEYDYESSQYEYIRMEEEDVISRLINSINAREYSDLQDFAGALFYPFDDFPNYKGIYVIERLLRNELGLYEDRQPGDIDILIIPYDDKRIFFERTAVYEVKVVRTTRKNPKRRPNRFGVKQIMGYIEDGFPFVSALHICMTEPLLPHEKQDMKFMLQPCNVDKRLHSDLPPLQAYQHIQIDWLPNYSMNNHMRRMIASGIPKYVGLQVISWNLSKGGQFIESKSFEYSRFEGCTWNPHKKVETVNLIEKHFYANKTKYHDIPIINKVYSESSGIDVGEIIPVTVNDEEKNAEEYRENSTDLLNRQFKTIQEALVPDKYILVEGFENIDNLLCFPVKGDAMDDGTLNGISDGSCIVTKDLGRPSFIELPMFSPICVLRVIKGIQQLFIGIITKKHEPSGLIRFSFYNVDDNWVFYKSIHQVFEVKKVLPKEGIVLKTND